MTSFPNSVKVFFFVLFAGLLLVATLIGKYFLMSAPPASAVVETRSHRYADPATNTAQSSPSSGDAGKPSLWNYVTGHSTKPSAGISKSDVPLTVPAGDPHSTLRSYVSPTTDLERVDIAYLSHATGHLDIAMYSFTDQYLADTLVRLANTGVEIRIYRDKEQYGQEALRHVHVIDILAKSPMIHIKVKNSDTLMHVKAFSDGRMLRDGSANWSPAGEKEQDNTLLITTDPGSVRNFETNFELLWDRKSNLIVQ